MPQRIRTIADMGISPVDPQAPIPLYYQIYMDLLNLIQSKQLVPDDLLPPEMELIKAYNVSRQTLRDALKILEDENLIKRTAGKGTVVLPGQTRIQFILSQSFAIQMKALGLTPGSKVLKLSRCVIDAKSPEKLRAKFGSPAMELVRLRYANAEPIGIQYSTIIIENAAGLPDDDFEKESLYNLLLTKYHLPINRVDYVVSAISADPWHQVLLNLSKPEPMLLVQTSAYLENGSPIEVTSSYYRADKFEFSNSVTFGKALVQPGTPDQVSY